MTALMDGRCGRAERLLGVVYCRFDSLRRVSFSSNYLRARGRGLARHWSAAGSYHAVDVARSITVNTASTSS